MTSTGAVESLLGRLQASIDGVSLPGTHGDKPASVVERVAKGCPLEGASDIDGWPADGAVVHADDSVERLQRGNVPLILLRDHTPHKLTSDSRSTPGCLDGRATVFLGLRSDIWYHN